VIGPESVWWALILGLLAGFALCFATLVPYVWRTRWIEGHQAGLVGYQRIHGRKR
jgi:hypothetical protein